MAEGVIVSPLVKYIDYNIRICRPRGLRPDDRDAVIAKFGVPPERIVDYLSLVGDTVDNVPGVSKVGPKTAAKWLGQYTTLDKLVADAANVSGKVGENLRAGLGTLELARKLATIRTDLSLPVTLDELKRKPPDVNVLRELYSRLELRSLLKQLDGGGESAAPSGTAAAADAGTGPATGAVPASSGITLEGPARAIATAPRMYETVNTEAELDQWIERLSAAPLFAFDTETTSLEYMKA